MTAPSPKPTEIAKPCPFCGGPAVVGTFPGKPGHGCADTECAGWHCWTSLQKWNRRAPALAPFEKLVEELRAEAEETRTHHGGGTFRLTGRQRPTWSELSDEGELLLKCADRLSAVVEEVRGTK